MARKRKRKGSKDKTSSTAITKAMDGMMSKSTMKYAQKAGWGSYKG